MGIHPNFGIPYSLIPVWSITSLWVRTPSRTRRLQSVTTLGSAGTTGDSLPAHISSGPSCCSVWLRPVSPCTLRGRRSVSWLSSFRSTLLWRDGIDVEARLIPGFASTSCLRPQRRASHRKYWWVRRSRYSRTQALARLRPVVAGCRTSQRWPAPSSWSTD